MSYEYRCALMAELQMAHLQPLWSQALVQAPGARSSCLHQHRTIKLFDLLSRQFIMEYVIPEGRIDHIYTRHPVPDAFPVGDVRRQRPSPTARWEPLLPEIAACEWWIWVDGARPWDS